MLREEEAVEAIHFFCTANEIHDLIVNLQTQGAVIVSPRHQVISSYSLGITYTHKNPDLHLPLLLLNPSCELIKGKNLLDGRPPWEDPIRFKIIQTLFHAPDVQWG